MRRQITGNTRLYSPLSDCREWEKTIYAVAPVLYILQLTSMCLYLSTSAHFLIGACVKGHDNAVTSVCT